jgi:hypothetical protein
LAQCGKSHYGNLRDRDKGNFDEASNQLALTSPGLTPYYDGIMVAEAVEESATANNIFSICIPEAEKISIQDEYNVLCRCEVFERFYL